MSTSSIGILWALVAMVGWGLGDYFIQRNVRVIGIWRTLIFINIIGTVILFPLVYKELTQIQNFGDVLYPIITGFVMLVATLFDFEALKQGKLAIMEPILSIELPIAAIFAVLIWSESISWAGWLLIIAIFIGITLAATEHHAHLQYHKRIFEKGVVYALITAVGMALADLLAGISSQKTSPLLTVYGIWVFILVITVIYLAKHGELKKIGPDFRAHPWALLAVGIFDTLGWIGFCYGAKSIPIAITTAIGQSYIVITILLGIFVNRELIKRHQIIGVATTVISVIALAWITG